MLSRFHFRVVLTLLLALGAAWLCVWLRTPLPWMIGPLLAVALLSIAGAPTRSWVPARNTGQWLIGTALGLYFTPQVTALVASLWWAVIAGIAWALLQGWMFGAWLYRAHASRMPHVSPHAMRATCWFSGAIGGASEMTLLAEREGARTDLVAAAHSVRILIVTVTIPFLMLWTGWHGSDALAPALRQVHLPGLALLLALTAAGAYALHRAGRTNPWFVGALAVSMAVTVSGVTLSAIPTWMSNAAQLAIAVSLGVRFNPDFIFTAPRWLVSVVLGTLGLMVAGGLFAWGLAWATGLPIATLVLGTAPGGIAEMAITAKVLQLGVPVVTAFQVCRLVAVLLLVDPLFRRLYGRRADGDRSGAPKP